MSADGDEVVKKKKKNKDNAEHVGNAEDQPDSECQVEKKEHKSKKHAVADEADEANPKLEKKKKKHKDLEAALDDEQVLEKKAKKETVDADTAEDKKAETKKRKHKEVDSNAVIETKDEDIAKAADQNKTDWKARKLEKKRRKEQAEQIAAQRGKKAQLKYEKKVAAIEEKNQQRLAKEKQNEALKKKGQLTKKQKYLAAKAAKQVQTAGGAATKASTFDVEEALAAAGLERLDPKAVSCFLTGVSYMATEQHVADHFQKIGPCTVQLLQDSVNGRSNGTGFINFRTAENALEAVSYSGSKLQGRWIKVRLCEPRESGARTREDGPGEKPDGCLSVVVKCDKSISEASLKRFFRDCEVANVSRILDKETGEFTGTAFLDFEDTSMVDKAVLLNGKSIKSFPLMVRYKMEKKTDAQKQAEAIARRGGVALHNRAPPIPPPSGKKTKLESDSDDD